MSNIVKKGEDKTLLILLPFWTPLIPPLGIASLKSYLTQKGYLIKTIDANADDGLHAGYFNYIDALKNIIPEEKHSNYYNIVNNVWQDHLMALINKEEEDDKFFELIEKVIFQTFFFKCSKESIIELTLILGDYIELFKKYFKEILIQEQPKVLGLSTYRGTLPLTYLAFKLAKEFNKDIRTVMGGGVFSDEISVDSPNFNYFLEKCDDLIDLVIIGEGEILFHKYLEGEIGGDKKIYSIQDLDNQVVNISECPSPDFSDFDISKYMMLSILGSRSCPFQCKFCSETIHGGKYRKKKASKIVKEFSYLSEKYNMKIFLMGDSLLNPMINEISNAVIENNLQVYWDGYLRVGKESASMENPLLWRKGGYYRARIGVESGSESVLKLMNKKISVSQIKDTIINLAQTGIKTTTYWVIGFPGETESDFQATLDLIEELSDFIYEADCNPYSFSYGGQINSDEMIENNEVRLLYDEKYRDLLMAQTWIYNKEFNREITYERVSRFVKHCTDLGIINPYSKYEIYKADMRWKALHKNSVPPLLELNSNSEIIDEFRYNNITENNVEEFSEEDWSF